MPVRLISPRTQAEGLVNALMKRPNIAFVACLVGEGESIIPIVKGRVGPKECARALRAVAEALERQGEYPEMNG